MPTPRILTGLVPPIPTPLTDDENLDVPSFVRLLEHVIDGGASGLFVLGTTGEFPLLTHDVKQGVCDVVAETVQGRVKICINVSETSVKRVLPLVRMAEAAGADCLAMIAPYYYPMDDAAIVNHYRCLSQETDLPILIYNFPRMSKVTMAPDVVEELIETANVAAIKDSSADMLYFTKLLALSRKHPHFSAMIAAAPLLAMGASQGADGFVTGLGNLAPRLVADLFEAARARDMARADALQRQADRITECFFVGSSTMAGIQAVKSALMLMRVFDSDRLAQPFTPLSDDELAQVRAILEREGVL